MMKGKVVIVTGGGSGIGRATAFAFATEGAKVVVADVSAEGGEDTLRLIREAGGDALFVKCDVSKSAEVQTVIQRTKEAYGGLDYAFNNAGIQVPPMPVVEYSEEIWDRIIGIDLKGVWLCMKYEIPEMLARGGGAIVNTASVAGLIGTPGICAYTAAKHGVVGLTKTVALEYAKAGIRVNAVCPGLIKTPLVEDVWDVMPQEMRDFLINAHPMGRMGQVHEVSRAVLWLCSDSASFITGTAMAIDGGLTAQ
jgi:NAD(P)-dependent dehydrogenase (short-subunit alcohol dehydrogenase family)